MTNPSNFHVQDDAHFEVKDLFKRISSIATAHFDVAKGVSCLDVGCASGELLAHLSQSVFPTGRKVGVDIGEELIASAKKRFEAQKIEFQVGDAESFSLSEKFDLVTATSLLSYWTDPIPVALNILRHVRPGGLAVITGVFNDFDFEVALKYRRVGSSEWHTGFNQYPLGLFCARLAELGWRCDVDEQVMPFDIPAKENKLRSWTAAVDGVRMNTNGLQLLWNIKIIKILSISS